MTREHIQLKTVNDLRLYDAMRPTRYYIPAYQRGYRWTTTQVTQLLEDVYEFTRRRNPQPDEYYCLQPLVVLARQDGVFEVVDGQQRLTTLLLILRHFNDRAAKKYQLPMYTLEYQTRPALATFLETPTEELARSNIDFFHIARSIESIERWFSSRESEVDVIKDSFLNRVKVIWFELAQHENPVSAFTRLNVGKIPLTNAELIRALLLKKSAGDGSDSRRLRIAYEWDLVEKTLQQPDLWAFVSNDSDAAGGRIEFLFKLVAQDHGMVHSQDAYATFNHFSERLAGGSTDVGQAWLDVKRVCMLLEEWFADRQFYHLVGFLIWAKVDINELRRAADGVGKAELRTRLKSLVAVEAFGEAPPQNATELRSWVADKLDDLTYPRDRRRIRGVLLLFNLATLLLQPRSNIRFNFHSFKAESWDIEHVRSVASAELGSTKLQVGWLEQTLAFLKLGEQHGESVALQQRIQEHLALAPKDGVARFEALYAEVLRYFHEDDGEPPNHGVENLVLLDQETNRSYRNAVFPVKRQRVIDLDAHGVFVPHCTRNVFLKSYSSRVAHVVYWTREDCEDYRNKMIDTLGSFLAEES